MTYQEQLLTPQWKLVREQIIYRDMGICQHCMTSKNLQVHHKYYIAGKMAWEYPPIALITLCDTCHRAEHSNKKIGTSSGLDMALARLIDVAQGMRPYSLASFIDKQSNG